MRPILYKPLPSQRRFHISPARFKAFCGPVGSGKSKALCAEALRLCYQNPGCMGLIGAPTLRMLRDSSFTQFIAMCRESKLPYDWNSSDSVLHYHDSDSTIIFRSLDSPDRLRGPNLAWFGIDELTYSSPEAWQRLEARLREPRAKRLCGFGVFTPNGFDWVYEKFRAPGIEGYDLIEAAPFENKHVLSTVPDFYDRLKRSYDSHFYEQEALGHFVNARQGRVYAEFDRNRNLRRVEYNAALPLRWAWDFNVNVMSSLICQESGGEVRVLDEIVLNGSSTPEVCREFEQRRDSHRGEVFVYGDASGGNAHSATGKSDYYAIRQFFQRRGGAGRVSLCVPRANPPVRDRVNTVNGKLHSAAGDTTLFIHPRCTELIKDLEQVSYKAGSSIVDKESDARRTHTSDALGYYLWFAFRPAAHIGEKNARIV